MRCTRPKVKPNPNNYINSMWHSKRVILVLVLFIHLSDFFDSIYSLRLEPLNLEIGGQIVWAKFRISYFIPLARQLTICHIISRWGFTVMAHHMGLTWRPVSKAHLRYYIESSYGLDIILSMAHVIEGPIAKLDHLWVIHSMGQPILWYTPPHGPRSSYESCHNLRLGSHFTVQLSL